MANLSRKMRVVIDYVDGDTHSHPSVTELYISLPRGERPSLSALRNAARRGQVPDGHRAHRFWEGVKRIRRSATQRSPTPGRRRHFDILVVYGDGRREVCRNAQHVSERLDVPLRPVRRFIRTGILPSDPTGWENVAAMVRLPRGQHAPPR